MKKKSQEVRKQPGFYTRFKHRIKIPKGNKKEIKEITNSRNSEHS
jgi:hypothetical protein